MRMMSVISRHVIAEKYFLSLSLMPMHAEPSLEAPQFFRHSWVISLSTCRFGYTRNLKMVFQTCMFTMISSFQLIHFVLHGLIVRLKVEKKVWHTDFGWSLEFMLEDCCTFFSYSCTSFHMFFFFTNEMKRWLSKGWSGFRSDSILICHHIKWFELKFGWYGDPIVIELLGNLSWKCFPILVLMKL